MVSYPGPIPSRRWRSVAADLRRPGSDLRRSVLLCIFRLVRCPYARLGCQWAGQFHKLSAHESSCAHPLMTGAELMEPLHVFDHQKQDEVKLYKTILDLMSCEKVVITGMSRFKASVSVHGVSLVFRIIIHHHYRYQHHQHQHHRHHHHHHDHYHHCILFQTVLCDHHVIPWSFQFLSSLASDSSTTR